MTKPLRVDAEAEAEAQAASSWYETRRPGLGLTFLAAFREALARIERYPHSGSPVPAVPDAEIRRVSLRRFPYSVVYLELADRLEVIALAHQRRRPIYWKSRIRI